MPGIEIYDPLTGQWSYFQALAPGAWAAAERLPDDRVWLTGGQAGKSVADFNRGTWLITVR